MSKFVVDDIGKVVASMRKDKGGPPFYMYGQSVEINNRQELLGRQMDKNGLRYPLIALKTKFKEKFDGQGYKILALNIVILAETIQERNAEERYEAVFKPVLYPLYYCFIEKLRKSGLFVWPNFGEDPPHEKIDHPHWGVSGSEGNVKHYFTDPLDAIELINLQVKQKKYC